MISALLKAINGSLGAKESRVRACAEETLRTMKFKAPSLGKAEAARPAIALHIAFRECDLNVPQSLVNQANIKPQDFRDALSKVEMLIGKRNLSSISMEELAFKFGGLKTRVSRAHQLLQNFRNRMSAQRSGDDFSDLSDPVYNVAAYFLASKKEGQSDLANFKTRLLHEHNVDKQYFQEICLAIDHDSPEYSETSNSFQATSQRRRQPKTSLKPEEKEQQQQQQRSSRKYAQRPQGETNDRNNKNRKFGSLNGECSDSNPRPAKKARFSQAARSVRILPIDTVAEHTSYSAWKQSALAYAGYKCGSERDKNQLVELATGMSLSRL